jgi:hypothetical protein
MTVFCSQRAFEHGLRSSMVSLFPQQELRVIAQDIRVRCGKAWARSECVCVCVCVGGGGGYPAIQSCCQLRWHDCSCKPGVVRCAATPGMRLITHSSCASSARPWMLKPSKSYTIDIKRHTGIHRDKRHAMADIIASKSTSPGITLPVFEESEPSERDDIQRVNLRHRAHDDRKTCRGGGGRDDDLQGGIERSFACSRILHNVAQKCGVADLKPSDKAARTTCATSPPDSTGNLPARRLGSCCSLAMLPSHTLPLPHPHPRTHPSENQQTQRAAWRQMHRRCCRTRA